MTELYNKDILRLATSIPLTERLEAPQITVVRTSRICGSRVTADFTFDGDAISAYGQGVKACALGQASCSILGRHIIGQTRKTFAPVADAMRHMLAGDGPPPAGEWAELEMIMESLLRWTAQLMYMSWATNIATQWILTLAQAPTM